LADARRVGDLFAGCGAFALPLAMAGKRVNAYELDLAQARTIDAAVRRAGTRVSVKAEVRDLERRPLAGAELAAFDGVVLDPPRIGAAAQARQLAASSVPTIVYVSCNPVTFARDAAVLVAGGYRLGPVTPLDQFLWSPHVELVATLRRR
jgi:23S rRNA (uracil1939-C5)-methyltransferase